MWLASHVSVLAGVTLSKGTVVGSKAVVTKSTKENEIVAGIPAVKISERR